MSVKNEPDFSMFNHTEVINMRLCLNKLMTCYSFSKEKKTLLKEMWKDLSNVCADKVSAMPEKDTKKKDFNKIFRRNILRKNKITLDKVKKV